MPSFSVISATLPVVFTGRAGMRNVAFSIHAGESARVLPPGYDLVVGKNIIHQVRPIQIVFIKIKLGSFGLIAIG